MITLEKLKIFEKYRGDGDGFVRVGKKHEKNIIQDDDWHEIDVLARKIHLVNSELASKEFKRRVKNELGEKVASLEAKEKIIAIAGESWYT